MGRPQAGWPRPPKGLGRSGSYLKSGLCTAARLSAGGLWELLTSGQSNPPGQSHGQRLDRWGRQVQCRPYPKPPGGIDGHTLTLDAGSQPPVGVANPAKIEFFVGTPPRRMVIFSGVAVTNFRADDEDNVAWEDVVVRLGDTTTENFTYTSTVGWPCCRATTPTSTSSPTPRGSTPTPSRPSAPSRPSGSQR